VHPQEPPDDEVDDAEEDLLPFAGAANTDSWMVWRLLSHFGQVIACFWFITSRSYL
jgi:hypothetical protein